MIPGMLFAPSTTLVIVTSDVGALTGSVANHTSGVLIAIDYDGNERWPSQRRLSSGRGATSWVMLMVDCMLPI